MTISTLTVAIGIIPFQASPMSWSNRKRGIVQRIIWISTLAGETLVRLTLGDGCTLSEEHLVEHRLGRLRDVHIDPSGVLYVLTDGPEGMLYRLNRGTGEEDKEKTHL